MLNKRAAEVRTYFVDFRDRLIVDELLTGTPTVAEIGSSALTISGVGLTVSPRDETGRIFVPTDKGVIFTVAGGTAGTSYTLRIIAGTNSTNAQTLIKELQLRVI